MKLGTFSIIDGLVAPEILSRYLDFLILDSEHGLENLSEQKARFLASKTEFNKGCEVFIRVPSLSRIDIQRYLEIGADGILVPQISSFEQASQAIDYSFYPPLGSRGVSPYTRPFGYEPSNLANKKIKIKDLDLYKKSANILSAIFKNFKRILIIRKNIKKQNPDLIIAHCSREIVLTFLACFFMKKKIIGYIHSDPKKLIKEKSKLWLIMTYISFSLINHSIVFSREARKQLPFLAQKKSIIIPNVSSESKYIKKDYTQKNIVMVVGR